MTIVAAFAFLGVFWQTRQKAKEHRDELAEREKERIANKQLEVAEKTLEAQKRDEEYRRVIGLLRTKREELEDRYQTAAADLSMEITEDHLKYHSNEDLEKKHAEAEKAKETMQRKKKRITDALIKKAEGKLSPEELSEVLKDEDD